MNLIMVAIENIIDELFRFKTIIVKLQSADDDDDVQIEINDQLNQFVQDDDDDSST